MLLTPLQQKDITVMILYYIINGTSADLISWQLKALSATHQANCNTIFAAVKINIQDPIIKASIACAYCNPDDSPTVRQKNCESIINKSEMH